MRKATELAIATIWAAAIFWSSFTVINAAADATGLTAYLNGLSPKCGQRSNPSPLP